MSLVTPGCKMAQAMAIVANGGTFLSNATRGAGADGGQRKSWRRIPWRAKKTINASSLTMQQVRAAMVDAVNAPAGTAHQASLDKVSVAGKRGRRNGDQRRKSERRAWFHQQRKNRKCQGPRN